MWSHNRNQFFQTRLQPDPPLQRRPRIPFPQPKKASLSWLPHLISPITPWYPLCHRRHQQPTLICAKYANAATFHDRFQANAVIRPTTGALQEFRHLIVGPDKATWYQLLANEFGRLAQGFGNRIDGTNTIQFISKTAVPFNIKNVTYPRFFCDMRPNKYETHQT